MVLLLGTGEDSVMPAPGTVGTGEKSAVSAPGTLTAIDDSVIR